MPQTHCFPKQTDLRPSSFYAGAKDLGQNQSFKDFFLKKFKDSLVSSQVWSDLFAFPLGTHRQVRNWPAMDCEGHPLPCWPFLPGHLQGGGGESGETCSLQRPGLAAQSAALSWVLGPTVSSHMSTVVISPEMRPTSLRGWQAARGRGGNRNITTLAPHQWWSGYLLQAPRHQACRPVSWFSLLKLLDILSLPRIFQAVLLFVVNSEFWKTWQLHLTLKNEKNFAIVLEIRKEGGYAPHVCTYTHSMNIPLLFLGFLLQNWATIWKGIWLQKGEEEELDL